MTEPSTSSNLALNPAKAASPFDFTPCPECFALVLVDNVQQHADRHAALRAQLRLLASMIKGEEA